MYFCLATLVFPRGQTSPYTNIRLGKQINCIVSDWSWITYTNRWLLFDQVTPIPYNTFQLTILIPVPTPINHVTKLFKGTYEHLRWPAGFFHESLWNFELRDTFGSSFGPLVSEMWIVKDLKNTQISDFLCTFGCARLRECPPRPPSLIPWGCSCYLALGKTLAKD